MRVAPEKEFVVRDVADLAAAAGQAVAEAISGVAEQHGVDAHRTEFESLLAQVAKHEMRPEFTDGDREIDTFHLRAYYLLDRQVALVGAVDLDPATSASVIGSSSTAKIFMARV